MNKISYFLKNATIIDGDNNPSFLSNILIENEKISLITKKNNINADIILDLSGKYVTPGFIDVHGHSDLQILRSPEMKSKIQQGITTEIAGNCGIGTFPIDLNDKNIITSIHDLTKDVLGSYTYDYFDFSSFCEKVDLNPPNTNVLFLQSHSALRANVIKPNANREATDDEIRMMCDLLDVSLKQGCIGFSTGLYYAPCLYADKKELLALLRVVKKHNKIFCTHHRCEGDYVISSLKEVIDLAKEVNVKLEISHLKAIGVENQKFVKQMLQMIDDAKNEGLDIGFDQYPYDYGSTSLYSLLPPKYLKLSTRELKAALNNKSEREIIKDLIIKGEGFDSIIKMCGFDNVYTMFLETQRELEHYSLRELSLKLKNKDDEDSCFETFFDILLKENGTALMMDITQSHESIEKILNHDLMCFGTDALYSGDEESNLPTHPRTYQAAVHLIDVYYKQRKSIDLISLINKMSGKCAKRFNIANRGIIKEGNFADIVVMDLYNLKDNSGNVDNKIPPEGIDYVFVNGNLVYKNKEIVNSNSGRVLRDFN